MMEHIFLMLQAAMSNTNQAMVPSSFVSFMQTDGSPCTLSSPPGRSQAWHCCNKYQSKCLVMALEASWRPNKSLLAALLLQTHDVFVCALATLRGTADLLVMTFSQMGQAESSDSTMLWAHLIPGEASKQIKHQPSAN